MEVEKLKQTILVNLRSVIQSCKGGVPLNRLQNDYKQLIGITIPFTSLGYNSIETFLQSIPQVVKLRKSPDGQILVEAVADSSTEHLQNLVSKQKNTKTQKCSVKRYSKRPASRPKPFLCSTNSSSKSSFNNSTGAYSSASSSWSIASEVSTEKDKEIEALKSKLAEQKKVNSELKSRVSQLLAQNEPHLEYENTQIMVQRIKYQIGLLQKKILLRHAASPEALSVNQHINGIIKKVEDLNIDVEKLTSNSTKINSSDVPKGDSSNIPLKKDTCELYQQQCKETEELKKQMHEQNSQIQSIERRMQSQLQKLQNQIKNDPLSSPSKESELAEDLKNQIQEQNLQIQNVEINMASELSNLKLQCKKTEEQAQVQNSQIQSIERRMQSQLQKFQNQIKNDLQESSSKESGLVEDLKIQIQEQNHLIANVEKKMSSEFSKLQSSVEKEYFVHIVSESQKLKDFEKQLKIQKSQLQGIEGSFQSQLQRLKNQVDKINMGNIAQMVIKQLIASNLINIPQLSSTSSNLLPNQTQLSTPNSVIGVAKAAKKKKNKTNSNGSSPATISSVMRDHY